MLFTGLILTDSGPKVLEYNARFGDPETQSVLLLLDDDTDLAEILLACTEKRLHEVEIKTRPGFACNVVVVADGYPGTYLQGRPITLGDLPDGKQPVCKCRDIVVADWRNCQMLCCSTQEQPLTTSSS